MPRRARKAPGGMVFHCINRGNDRREIFDDAADYGAFERVMGKVIETTPMRVLAYCLMPNHFHLLLWPRADGHLAAFMQRLQVTHVRRWHEHRHSTGCGHLYQGPFKSFPVQADEHFLTVARYVERNALRARMVRAAENWRYSSLWRREKGSPEDRGMLAEWPVRRPADWLEWVNQPQSDKELEQIRRSVNKGQPFGSVPWQQKTAAALGLESTFRKPGRPRKTEDA